MVDETHNATAVEPEAAQEHADAAGQIADHPHAGIAEEGWSAPPPADEATTFARLVVKRSGAETDLSFPICSPAVIGRFDPGIGPIDVDLASLPEGAYVSRRHAKICQEDGVWKIEDMGSSNGTFILRGDFERVTDAPLEDGTEIALGNARFVFHLDDTPASCPTP